MGLFSKFKSKKLYDKTLMMYIPVFSEINPSFAQKVEGNIPAQSKKIAEDHLIELVRKHYYEDLRPPVKWNFNYTVTVIPRLPDHLRDVNCFWDSTGKLVNKTAYRQMCNDTRTVWKEGLVSYYTDYDRSKLEDGFENVHFDYYPEEGMLIVSMILEKLLPIE